MLRSPRDREEWWWTTVEGWWRGAKSAVGVYNTLYYLLTWTISKAILLSHSRRSSFAAMEILRLFPLTVFSWKSEMTQTDYVTDSNRSAAYRE